MWQKENLSTCTDIESLKFDKQFLSISFSEYRILLIVFDICSNFLKNNVYANLLTKCDNACVNVS